MPEETAPLFCGIVLNEQTEYEGNALVTGNMGQEIIDIFFETAVSCGIELPERFIFKSGEIFYQDNRIREIRLTVLVSEESNNALRASVLNNLCK